MCLNKTSAGHLRHSANLPWRLKPMWAVSVCLRARRARNERFLRGMCVSGWISLSIRRALPVPSLSCTDPLGGSLWGKLYRSPSLSVASLSTVLAPCSQPQSKNMKRKIPERNASSVSSRAPVGVMRWSLGPSRSALPGCDSFVQSLRAVTAPRLLALDSRVGYNAVTRLVLESPSFHLTTAQSARAVMLAILIEKEALLLR